MTQKVYTLSEAAEYLRVSTKWLRGACKDGAPHIRMAEKLLFTDRHLEQILDSYEAKPVSVAPPKARTRKKTPPVGEVVELRAKTPYRLRHA